MGRIIDFDLNFEKLLDFAEKSLVKGDTLSCALNLNEALTRAESREDRRKVYELFIKCFSVTDNARASVTDVIAKDVSEREDDEYYRMDFDLRKRGDDYVEEEADYEQLKEFNEVKNLINERRYDEALSRITPAMTSLDYMESVVGALIDAVGCDKRLNLDKYIIPLIGIMTTAPCQIEMLQLLLEGGKTTHKLMVDSADYLLDDDDSNSLCFMGMAYFQSNEPETAERFFLKVLDIDPIDEDALYYMSVIGVLLEREDRGAKYWNRFKEVYKITEPPVDLLEEFFRSDDITFLVPYQTLPVTFLERVSEQLIMDAPNGDIDDAYAVRVMDYAKLAPAPAVVSLIKSLGKTADKPKLQNTYVKLLSSSRVSLRIKRAIVDVLVADGYEGDACLLTDARVVYIRFAKLHRRVQKNWTIIYKALLRNIPFSETYIPLRCSVLSAVIKKLDGLIAPSEEDLSFALAIALVNYLRRLRVNIDVMNIVKELEIDADAVDAGLSKFGLDNIFI